MIAVTITPISMIPTVNELIGERLRPQNKRNRMSTM